MSQKSSQIGIKIVLASIVIAQMFIGLVGLCAGTGASKVIEVFYGVTLQLNQQTDYLFRLAGAYVVTVALLAGYAFLDPQKNRPIINCLIALMCIRFLEVVIFSGKIQQVFNIAPWKVWFDAGIFLLMAVLLIVFYPRKTV